jgi:hypothetical protein
VASNAQLHKVAVGIGKEIKAAAFEDGNSTALKVEILHYCSHALRLPFHEDVL